MIRIASRSDIADILYIDQCSENTPLLEVDLDSFLRSGNSFIFIFENDNSGAVGFIAVRVVVDEAEIWRFGVLPDFRSRGVGRALLSGVVKYLQEKNIYDIYLEVRASNRKAIRLYRSSGFVPSGKRKNYYRYPEEDALLMKKSRKHRFI